jgi:hypothetical protein
MQSNNTSLTLRYDVTALDMPIYFNKEGDHDHNGMIFALTKNVPILKYIRALAENRNPGPPSSEIKNRAREIGVSLPLTPHEARLPHPLVRPLVLRATKGDRVIVKLRNELRDDEITRHVGLHLVGDGYDVKEDDGSHIGLNPSSLVAPSYDCIFTWDCRHEGVFPFHDGGNYSGEEDGTNVHGLFGALIVEPPGAIWRDPVTGRRSVDGSGNFRELDGLYLDVLPAGPAQTAQVEDSESTLETHQWQSPVEYHDFNRVAHREFVIFFHDEPEFQHSHSEPPPNPCGHPPHEHPPIMPISYRAEPMINREHILWRRINDGNPPNSPVLNEEQHHSSWMFGDPETPILKAYIGDPVRIRFVHAAVKETHVFHLHLYEWHAVPQDLDSPRIDAISISPQTAHTIEPLWGAGNRHQVAGDVIWHCHLYPHFHEGMWGMFRTFETLQTGEDGDYLQSDNPIYAGRRIGRYPNGTRIEKLLPLPGRPAPPRPTPRRPGYPLFIAGEVNQKSPRPPWPDRDYQAGEEHFCDLDSLLAADMPADFDYRPVPTDLERNAFNEQPLPAELFTRNSFTKQQKRQWEEDPRFQWNIHKQVCRDVVVAKKRIDYNGDGWHDKDGHLYYLEDEGDPDTRPGPKEPLFFRANHGQILNLTLRNDLPHDIEETEFDPQFPPCRALDWEGECALHVHMVKFDPICGDGASVGWNYMSGARFGMKMVYRWWADKEFGTIFFHDHLFANYRQKHGLFGALIVEPKGAKFFHNFEPEREIVSGLQAIVVLREPVMNKFKFREFCIGIGDFIPMWDRRDDPLNPPAHPGGHGDQGVMGLNYRNTPVRKRPGDPAYWFSSLVHGRPYTTLFAAYENDPLWFRLIQGSHEEQHSFQIHGMRWRRFRENFDSSIRNQQTFGIAEAFTFINHESYGAGDYMYKLSGADDLWLGCWGIIRAYRSAATTGETGGLLKLNDVTLMDNNAEEPTHATENGDNQDDFQVAATITPPPPRRRFYVVAEPKMLVYRDRLPKLVDPFALVFRVTKEWRPGDTGWRPVPPGERIEPLVLRCRQGEQVEVTLENRLFGIPLQPEPYAPEVPVEKHNRRVSRQVSMHADLVRYNVTKYDGANVGRNPIQTIFPGYIYTYVWRTDKPVGSDENQFPLGPVLLQDMADFRHHRHHGLVGSLVIEETEVMPLEVKAQESTAGNGAQQAWHGARATLVKGAERIEEIVLLLQDGLRLYRNGNTNDPVPDFPPDADEDDMEKEDQGQKAFNYRSEIVGIFDPGGPRDILGIPNPATPVWKVPVGKNVRFHLVGASDKPRNYSFTIHGVTWPEWRFLENNRPMVASESAITCGTVRTFEFVPEHTGDHAYRSGMLKWSVHQGLWGILRVVGDTHSSSLMEQQEALQLREEDAVSTTQPQNLGTSAVLTGLAVGLGLFALWKFGRRAEQREEKDEE